MQANTGKKIIKFFVAAALCLMVCLCVNPQKVQAAAKAKVVLEFTDGTKKTWKTGDKKIKLGKKKLAYVYFGEYPQTEVTGKNLTKAITGAKYNKNGVATVNGVKYKRLSKDDATYSTEAYKGYYEWNDKTYAYFKYEPIKWRVLNTKKGTALILSEYIIDDQRYNEEKTDITWADCTLRKWLNDGFLTTAFNAKNRKLIKKTTLKNEDTYYGVKVIEGGENTKDKIFNLSFSDILNTKYGFSSDKTNADINRRCSSTAFAKAMGVWTSTLTTSNVDTAEGKNASAWWLRGPGNDSVSALNVGRDGGVSLLGIYVSTGTDGGVRPALTLNLSSIIE